MAIFRNGIKIPAHDDFIFNKDIRVGVGKGRIQGLLRKHGIIKDGKGRKEFEKDARGEVQMIRTAVAQAEGFTFPVNYQLKFNPPKGISHPTFHAAKDQTGDPTPDEAKGDWSYPTPNGYVRGGGLDWKTNKMNFSCAGQKLGQGTIWEKYNEAAKVASTLWNKNEENTKVQGQMAHGQKTRFGDKRSDTTLNLYCSKVTIPEKSINMVSLRQYGSHFPWPQSVSYGTLTTTFYCDGAMKIKNFFDAWQKLIWNDLTGNFNYYNEYTSEFDIFTRATIASGGTLKAGKDRMGKAHPKAEKISSDLKAGTAALNNATGVDGPRAGEQAKNNMPTVEFRNNYGVKIFQCFPQIVGSIDLGHANSNAIAEFNVTWAYKKWNPFKMGDVGNRSQINLAVGEFRNEKDGFPFLEDLPGELSGPLTGAMNQGINTGPLSQASPIFG
ncbi:uncharacterized protein METZ01_LOCUS137710 [marine metagenome]|uniref:Uncharacterized protein n=1 Tax=marine metagenome TaxID=408172 RepID=A0A381Z6D8_9ZZZZ